MIILTEFSDKREHPTKEDFKTVPKEIGIETQYCMIRKFLAKATSKRHNLRQLHFYQAILLYNIWILMNFVSRVKIIAVNMRIFIASKLIRAKSFVAIIVESNRNSGCAF